MKISDFDQNLMTSRPIFNEELILAGQVIEVYKVDSYCKRGSIRHFRTGIIEKVDHTMIKYVFFNDKDGNMSSGFLYPNDILLGEATDEQWEGRESLYLIKVVETRKKEVYVDGFEHDDNETLPEAEVQ